MKNDVLIRQRSDELEQQGLAIQFQDGAMGRHAEGPVWRKWATSAHSLIKSVLGETSPHCVHFDTAHGKCRGLMWEVQPLLAIFAAAKEDYEGGYLFNLR
jgi:hypothetical protein